MKKLLLALLGLFIATNAFAATPALQVFQGGTGSSTLTGILIGNGTSSVQSLILGSNLSLSGTTLSATGGGGSFPFTSAAYGVSTSTTVGFLGGMFSVGSSTIQDLHATNFTLGTLSGGLGANNGVVYAGATTTAGTGLTYTNGSFTVDLGTSIDISTETNLGAIFPLSISGDNVQLGIVGNTLGGTGKDSSSWSGSVGINSGTWYQSATTTFSTGLTYANGNVTCDTASSSVFGCLSAADWTTFNNKSGFGYPFVNGSGYFATTTGGIFNASSTIQELRSTNATFTGTVTKTNATVIDHVYVSYPYSTTTAWIGTTSPLYLGVEIVKKTWNTANCFTSAGTVNAQFYYIQTGTTQVKMNMLPVTTSTSTQTFSTNNAVPAGSKIFAEYGTPASTPTVVVCSIDKTRNL